MKERRMNVLKMAEYAAMVTAIILVFGCEKEDVADDWSGTGTGTSAGTGTGTSTSTGTGTSTSTGTGTSTSTGTGTSTSTGTGTGTGTSTGSTVTTTTTASNERTESNLTIATGAVGKSVYTGTLGTVGGHLPVKSGSMTIFAGGYVLTDSGGTFSGTAGSKGTINYTTGAWSIDLNGADLANGTAIIANYVYYY